MSKPQDHAQREEVLDVSRSFIVQAPAGSGKTSLLTQRFLRLLTRVNNPEEILAITFTKKAAAEMHQRIIESIKLATKPRPTSEFESETWVMATQVLQRDEDCQWHLLQNPNRLRVQTIDSLCAQLARQLPVTARFGSSPAIQQDSQALYIEAARNSLQELDDDDEVGRAIRTLLAHVDNQFSRAEGLLSAMLASRDQWLRHVMSHQSDISKRKALEAVLQRTIVAVLSDIVQNIMTDQQLEIKHLLEFACANIDDKSSPIRSLAESFDMSASTVESLPAWLMLSEFLLTKAGTWRKQADAKIGFPAPSNSKNKDEKALFSERKNQFKALLLALQENSSLTEAFTWLRCLPAANYSDQQWAVIQALLVILPRAVAHLRLVFQQTGQVDFCEVSLSAGHALHDASGATDIGLKLDYQLQHILVDEFQDTSETQFMLLKDLVSGWQHDDGRTLFLVGDPMQSIYRFRQAEVGLFLKTQQEGLGEVRRISPVNIAVNFRSQKPIVDWVNKAFKAVMPEVDNVFSGAISYKPSAPFKTNDIDQQAVHYYPHKNRVAEGQSLLTLIQQLQHDKPNETIGVLVKGRSHLSELVIALNKAGVRYQATDIDPLNKRQTVIDLMSLTRAYLQPADRVAWLSVLRAPWCALSLADMHRLLDGYREETMWALLHTNERLVNLSKEGQKSVSHLLTQFDRAIKHRERMGLAGIIKGLWSDLLGPECLSSPVDLSDSERFFDCLAELESNGLSIDMSVLENRIEKLYAAANVNAPKTLQIMTIHKSKGLEFDHVILPGLDRRSRHDDKALLAWLERPSESLGETELLIAPIKQTGAEGGDQVGRYLNKIEQEKSIHESQRLLYVAATRAKKQLYLSFTLAIDEKKAEPKKPASNTLLGLLWPSIFDEVVIDFNNDKSDYKDLITNCLIKKLNLNEVRNPTSSYRDYEQETKVIAVSKSNVVEFDWAGDLAASIGTVCHQIMQMMGERGSDTKVIDQQVMHQLLCEAGVLPHFIDEALSRTKQIITSCLQDKRGQWVLNNQHESSQFELALSGVLNGEVVHCRLDRTFVDQGQRWIIDYKTSRHDDDNKDQFLDNEVIRYKAQLERYAQLMSAIDSRPIMLGLYYPAFAGWRSWAYKDA